MNIEEHKKDIMNCINSLECQTKNQLIALLELKKYELIKELFDEEAKE